MSNNQIKSQIGQFSIVPMWVLTDLVETKQPEALRLYVALSKWTNGLGGTCYPSRSSIARFIGCSDRTVDYYVKALVSIGALTVDRRVDDTGLHSSSIYTVLVVRTVAKHASPPPVADFATGSEADFAQTNTQLEPIPNEPYSLLTPAEMSLKSFDEFWNLYPRKVGKKKCRTAWKNLTQTQRASAITAIGAHVAYWERAGRSSETIPHPTTWIHGESWDDEIVAVRSGIRHTETRQSAGDAAIERIRLKYEQQPLPKELTS